MFCFSSLDKEITEHARCVMSRKQRKKIIGINSNDVNLLMMNGVLLVRLYK